MVVVQILLNIFYLLLRYGLRKEYGINENVVLSEGSCGKPYLSNYPFVHFNLSHCDKGVAYQRNNYKKCSAGSVEEYRFEAN